MAELTSSPNGRRTQLRDRVGVQIRKLDDLEQRRLVLAEAHERIERGLRQVWHQVSALRGGNLNKALNEAAWLQSRRDRVVYGLQSEPGMAIKLGMCGFTIGAAQYFRQFRVVEVQQTFYDPPQPQTLMKWRALAPRSFEFTMKAWQVITHLGTSSTYRRLRSHFSIRQRAEAGGFRPTQTVFEAWEKTVACAALLRATGILFQCPASFRPTEDNISAMRGFFGEIIRPEGVRLLWEPRGAWPDEIVLGLCSELNLVHAVDPFVRPSLTPDLLYWRLHGNGNHYANYTDDELRQIHAWLPADPAVDAYVLFNNIPRVQDVKRFVELGATRLPL
jgi:uncharacterized protein YecE (DUF72 family)